MNPIIFIIRQYIEIAFRNILKFRLQSFIAVFGLAFALLCFVPALYWMRYETTYDSFYPDANQIYRIYSVEKQSGKINERVPGILSKYLLNHFPAIETSTDFAYERFDYNDLEAVKLQKAILSLPTKQQLAFNLRYYDELEYDEIAAITGSTAVNVKANYHLAKEKIIKYMNSTD